MALHQTPPLGPVLFGPRSGPHAWALESSGAGVSGKPPGVSLTVGCVGEARCCVVVSCDGRGYSARRIRALHGIKQFLQTVPVFLSQTSAFPWLHAGSFRQLHQPDWKRDTASYRH
ncbi:unnamed protein product [Pleuronectes platessa]|uniref:Uncharacterized protein n=1 Tax=Pleuronectes platessa TaxID=8262 RepID=A0A9N7VDH9_PLEPL|nr:unnamed protein product [Pleuronectes platessa]